MDSMNWALFVFMTVMSIVLAIIPAMMSVILRKKGVFESLRARIKPFLLYSVVFSLIGLGVYGFVGSQLLDKLSWSSLAGWLGLDLSYGFSMEPLDLLLGFVGGVVVLFVNAIITSLIVDLGLLNAVEKMMFGKK